MRFLLVVILFIANSTIAQRLTIQGALKDSTGNALQSATVMILSAKDSVLLNFTTTNANGSFEIKNFTNQDFILKISFVGYIPFVRKITMGSTSLIDVGEIRLHEYSNELDEVTIVADRPPVVVKKDTIEYNSESFKTTQNASVEELLKKLPGVEVASDGTIRAQGEQVQRMTVDGKNFFGSDPKIASKNLPADAVSKVQVYDKKSDQAVFSGIDDGQREKTINLELKPEKRNGAFGNILGGIGTNERFNARASVNRFAKTKQLSFLGLANNVNQQGFGIEEYMNFTGGSQQIMSGRGGQVRVEFDGGNNTNGVPMSFGNRPNGLLSSYAAGVNFNNEINAKAELSSSYFYNQLDHQINSDLERVNYLPDGSESTYTEKSNQRNQNYNHRGYAVIDYKIDSSNSMKFSTTGIYNKSFLDMTSASQTVRENEILNTNARDLRQDGSSLNSNSTLLWRHKFARKGRTFSTNVQINLLQSNRDGYLSSLLGNNEGQRNVDQNSNQQINNGTYGATLNYTEPLGNRKYLEANVSFRLNQNDLVKEVYDVESGSSRNELLSTSYTSAYLYKRGGINFRTARANYNVVFGGSVQQTSLNGELMTHDVSIAKDYTNFLPQARFAYDFSTTKHLSFDFESNVQEPSIQQLQPVIDNSDPVNLYTGNPNLRPAYSSNLRLQYRGMNPMSFVNFFAFANATFTNNAIVNAQTISPQGVRLVKPVNISSSQRQQLDVNFGFPISPSAGRINLGSNISNDRSFIVLNEVESKSTQHTLSARIRYDFRYQEVFFFGMSYQSSRQSAKYDFEGNNSQLFFNNTASFDGSINFLKHYTFGATVEYLKYINKTIGVEQAVPLVDLTVSRYLLKGRSAELRLGVYNLLNKNIGLSQSFSLNYYERQQYNNLGRYFMLSFIFSLNKQLNPMGAPPGGNRMIRIMG